MQALNCRIRTAPSKESELMRIYSSCADKPNRRFPNSRKSQNSHRDEAPTTTHRSTTRNNYDSIKKIKENEWTTKRYRQWERVVVTDTTTEKSDYDYTTDDEADRSTDGDEEGTNRRREMVGIERGGEIKLGEDYSDDLTQYENYRTLIKRAIRKEVGRRKEKSSPQRSRYNPNARRRPKEDESLRDEEDSEDNEDSSKDEACALHCFMETLKMTDERGFPNRHLVMQAITKDIEDEELKEFLQESTEECFEILNASKDDKCDFAKDLLICLSDKGKNNCDDWKNDGRDVQGPVARGYSNLW
ncbi:unnamed protein product, partial [Iphiclides podalirius]